MCIRDRARSVYLSQIFFILSEIYIFHLNFCFLVAFYLYLICCPNIILHKFLLCVCDWSYPPNSCIDEIYCSLSFPQWEGLCIKVPIMLKHCAGDWLDLWWLVSSRLFYFLLLYTIYVFILFRFFPQDHIFPLYFIYASSGRAHFSIEIAHCLKHVVLWCFMGNVLDRCIYCNFVFISGCLKLVCKLGSYGVYLVRKKVLF